MDKLKWGSRSPSPGSSGSFPDRFTMTRPRVERRNNTANQAISTSAVSHSQYELIEPVVWTKALKIARKKLNDNSLPPLDLTTHTSQSAEKNIEAIVKGLKTLQEDNEKKRWSYTWHGKKVIVVERLAKILRYVEKYSKVVDTAVQSQPEVSALVWAGVWGIMRVCI